MRFDKLELSGEDSKPRKQPAAAAAKDENHWLAQADQQRRCGHYENALRYYSRALEIEKSLVVAWVGQVQMLVQLGEYPQADLWSRKALELFPNQPDLLSGRAQALCRIGDRQTAHGLSDNAMQQRGDSAYGWMVRGELMVAGRQSMDGHCFDRAHVASRDWLVPLESALIYLFYRSPSKALQRAQKATEAAPAEYYPWFVQGRCQQELGFTEAARNSFTRCLELCPQHAEASERLAELDRTSWTSLVRRWIRRG